MKVITVEYIFYLYEYAVHEYANVKRQKARNRPKLVTAKILLP